MYINDHHPAEKKSSAAQGENGEMQQSIWNCLLFSIMEMERLKTVCEPPKLTNSFELLIVKDGKAMLKLEEESFLLLSEDVCVIHPSQVYSIQSKNAEEVDYYLYKFDVLSGNQQESALVFQTLKHESHHFPLKGKIASSNWSAIIEAAERLYLLRKHQTSEDHFQKRILFEQLIYLLLASKNSAMEKDTLAAVEETRRYMEKHFHENITVESLARKAKVSPKYYSALFKKEYGINLSDYLTRLRVSKAKSLLARNDERLCSIANLVGYNDEFYLSRKFKKVVGMSPSAYRKQRQRKIAAYDFSGTGHLLALKIFPYAAPIHPKWTSSYYHAYRNDIPVHLSAFQINKDWQGNIDKLTTDPPDVIISRDEISEEEKGLLQDIAPVFYFSHKLCWRGQLLRIAKFLGEEQEAEEWLRHYDRQVTYTRKQIAKRVGDETFLPLRFYRGTLYFDCSRTMTEVICGDLSLKLASAAGSMPLKQAVSLEILLKINPDRLLVNVCQESLTLDSWKALQKSGIWNDLHAVRSDHVYFIASDPWREYSASAHERVLQETAFMF
ncbi:ABC-type Fe3+-hydroxamate transport system, substrate-binding protein [Evansella caseinilytica]|uniref:ABC-type Fe3+-hydroxamate transport system, substrate-binding protein n=1 Tax=Evansella caseinilytica TaxID=1503961 RepID=A0A1H3STE3_9BACI|nr:helix-turn-helix domain-containing protein [Evansella caseinilytica]SDZ40987.1 ABC-type Fe3+-hydroxamate transport system, substrate-binding protein [Evansella caseinilytica]